MSEFKEESRIGKTPFNAIDAGFRRAMVTILDANLTTLDHRHHPVSRRHRARSKASP